MAYRIDTPTAQKDKFGAGKNGFTSGNPQTGTPATDLDAEFFDMLQEEIVGVVEAASIDPDKSKDNQLLAALKALFLDAASNGSDIPDKAAFLQNLGLVDTVTKAAGAMQKTANGSDIANATSFLGNLGISFTAGSGYIILKIGPFILACGNANATTTSDGNLNVTLPTAFPNTVMYSNATQANSSYATDTNPIIYSPYAIGSGPITAAGFAARNTKTGAAIINTVVAARYFVVGF